MVQIGELRADYLWFKVWSLGFGAWDLGFNGIRPPLTSDPIQMSG
jgi:hypothetical protein